MIYLICVRCDKELCFPDWFTLEQLREGLEAGYRSRFQERATMAKPSEKTETMEQAIKDIFGVDRRELIRADCCVAPPIGCGRENIAGEFRNEISQREYTISGLCQKCQDEIFGED